LNYNSWTFWILLLAVLVPYWHLTHKQQNRLLLVASYVFYGFWDYRFLMLVLIATCIDFVGGLAVAGVRLPVRTLLGLVSLVIGGAALLCTGIPYAALAEAAWRLDTPAMMAALPLEWGRLKLLAGTAAGTAVYLGLVLALYRVPRPQRRQWFVALSLSANLALLGFFKYCDFFVESLQQLLDAMGMGYLGGRALGIVLPPGISFYTFQAMSYTVDVYRRHARPTRSLPDFALFVCFFPHLVAGPIMRAATLLPQVVRPRQVDAQAWEDGLFLVVMGLFKKVVIADNMAPIANRVFYAYVDGSLPGPSGAEILLGVYAFALQIYGDFSGYSAIARGISKWLGFELVINFHLPYLATSPSDFWRRWHISLSTWLRDYLYIPLGGNRHGELATYRNLMITMLLGGLWHGARWTFVAWGLYHGLILCLFPLLGIRDPVPGHTLVSRLNGALRVLVMFHLTCLGWLLFRADSLAIAARMMHDLAFNFHLGPSALPASATIVFLCGLPLLLEWALDGEQQVERLVRGSWLARGAVYTYLASMLLIFPADRAQEFIYFQF
jgi:D-alanyl-lipoteichoic acid acyltransferase DltB (MBOAT superfamily)